MMTHTQVMYRAVGVERIDLRVALLALTGAFYLLTFVPLYEQLGLGVLSLSAVPVALIGWLIGLRPGLIAGALAFPINVGLLWFDQSTALSTHIWAGAVAGSAALLVGAVAGTLRDVTDQLHRELSNRQEAERGLRDSEERLVNLVESAPGFLITIDRDATVLYSNRPIAGQDAKELRGTNMLNFVPKGHHKLFSATLARVFDSGDPDGYEIADSAYDDEPTLHLIRFGPVKRDGKVIAATLLSVDVPEDV